MCCEINVAAVVRLICSWYENYPALSTEPSISRPGDSGYPNCIYLCNFISMAPDLASSVGTIHRSVPVTFGHVWDFPDLDAHLAFSATPVLMGVSPDKLQTHCEVSKF